MTEEARLKKANQNSTAHWWRITGCTTFSAHDRSELGIECFRSPPWAYSA